MTTITIDLHNGEQLLLVGVPMDTYRFDLIKNKELKHRYGKLEYTTREKGYERFIALENIEQYEELGTWIPRTDVIDFEVDELWVLPCDDNDDFYDYEYTGSLGDDGLYDNALETKEKSFLSLLKSHTKDSEAEKFLILKIEKK